MKVQNIIRSLTVSFGLVMAIMLFGVGSAFAAVNLPNVIIPAGGARNSASFNVTDTGLLTVRVKIKNTAWFGIGGQSRYRAQLMRGNTEVDRAERVVASDFETVTLSVNIASCNQKGSYHVRVSNISSDNPQQGEAQFPAFDPPRLEPITGNLSMFGVLQGDTVTRNIPNSLEPFGNGGRLKITATWDSLLCPDLAGCKLTFILKRNGSEITQSTGYAHNALLGNANPKMTIDIPVSQVSGDWTFNVKGTSLGSVINVKPTVSFTPQCQQ